MAKATGIGCIFFKSTSPRLISTILNICLLTGMLFSCSETHPAKKQSLNPESDKKYQLNAADSASYHLQKVAMFSDTVSIYIPNYLTYKTHKELADKGFHIGHRDEIFLEKSDSVIVQKRTKQSFQIHIEEGDFENANEAERLDEFKKELLRMDKSVIFRKSLVARINGLKYLWVEDYSPEENRYAIVLNTFYDSMSYDFWWSFPNKTEILDSLVYYKSLYSLKLKGKS